MQRVLPPVETLRSLPPIGGTARPAQFVTVRCSRCKTVYVCEPPIDDMSRAHLCLLCRHAVDYWEAVFGERV